MNINKNNIFNIMNAKEALTEIKKLLFTENNTEFALVEGKLVDGTIVSYDLATAEIYVIGADGMKVPAPIGEHQLETGEILVVVEDGKISEVKEAEAPTEEVVEAEPMAEMVPATDVVDPKMAEMEASLAELSAKVEEMASKMEQMIANTETMSSVLKMSMSVLEELSTETSAEPIQKANNFRKVYKEDKNKSYTKLQESFKSLKK